MCELEVVWQLASLSDFDVQCLPETKVRNKRVVLAPDILRWVPLHDLAHPFQILTIFGGN